MNTIFYGISKCGSEFVVIEENSSLAAILRNQPHYRKYFIVDCGTPEEMIKKAKRFVA